MVWSVRRPLRLEHILASLLVATGLGGCSRAPAEPERDHGAASSSSSSAAAAPTPAVVPLTWEVPGSWTVLNGPTSGARKAGYNIPKAGDDKEDAEVSVLFYGTGALGDVEKNFSEWFTDFDGDVGATAKRESFDVHGFKVETVEVFGTYKVALGPKIGPKKKAPMQMVKKDWRLLGAVVKTPDRGNWFFKIVGPDDTMQSARSGVRTMLESVK